MLIGVYATEKDAESAIERLSKAQFALNTAVTAVGVWGGPVAAGAAALYFGVDYFYPDLFQKLLNELGRQSPTNTCTAHQ